MNSFTKFIAMPVETEVAAKEPNVRVTPEIVSKVKKKPQKIKQKEKKTKTRDSNKKRLLLLRLASINAYNKYGYIASPSGIFMPNTNISSLIKYALNETAKAPAGATSFTNLLAVAGVTPNDVNNLNVKRKLARLITPTPYLYKQPDISERIYKRPTYWIGGKVRSDTGTPALLPPKQEITEESTSSEDSDLEDPYETGFELLYKGAPPLPDYLKQQIIATRKQKLYRDFKNSDIEGLFQGPPIPSPRRSILQKKFEQKLPETLIKAIDIGVKEEDGDDTEVDSGEQWEDAEEPQSAKPSRIKTVATAPRKSTRKRQPVDRFSPYQY